MTRRNLSAVIRYLRQLTGSANGSGASDAELLERYVHNRDEAAFELLLWRHGTLVFNVCRRILPREQDAEDAFQATFLTFVRKAASIRCRGSVASWLYKVAYRIALEAKERARKTAAMEKPGGENLAVQPASDPTWSDMRPILDEELNRLPERLRQPLVLCYLEGKSNVEAARELGCRLGTIYSRLSRGREMLRQRLQRRGVTLSIAALTAAVPAASLVRAAARTALLFADPSAAAAVSPRVAALAEGVLRTMFVTKLKIAAVMFLVVSIAAGSVLTYARTAAPQTRSVSEGPPPKPADGDNKKDAEPITVRVVEPKKGGMPLMVTRPANVVAAQQQQVVPLISGIIKEVCVDIGDRVKKGQTLIVLDAPQLVKEREQAVYALRTAKAAEDQAKAQVVMAEAEVSAAKALQRLREAELAKAISDKQRWQSEVKRIAREVEKAVVDPQVLLESQAQLAGAEAKVKAAEAAVQSAEADIKIKQGKHMHAKAAFVAATAAAGSAQTAVDKARIQEDFTQLKAACDGVVTRRTLDAGNFVQPSDSRLLRPLLTVQRIDSVRIVARVYDQYALLIQRGMPVEVGIAGIGLRKYKISRFSPSIEESWMTVEIDVPNADNRLLPGMGGEVKLPLEKTSSDSLIVPSACIYSSGAKDKWVSIVRDGKVYLKSVTVRFQDSQNAEITEGIKASDFVITDKNTSEWADGTPVKIEKAP